MKVNYVSVSSDKLRAGIADAGLSLEEASIKACGRNKDYFASCLRGAKSGKCRVREERFIKICELCNLDPNDLRLRVRKKSTATVDYDQMELPLAELKESEASRDPERELRIDLVSGIIDALTAYRDGLSAMSKGAR